MAAGVLLQVAVHEVVWPGARTAFALASKILRSQLSVLDAALSVKLLEAPWISDLTKTKELNSTSVMPFPAPLPDGASGGDGSAARARPYQTPLSADAPHLTAQQQAPE